MFKVFPEAYYPVLIQALENLTIFSMLLSTTRPCDVKTQLHAQGTTTQRLSRTEGTKLLSQITRFLCQVFSCLMHLPFYVLGRSNNFSLQPTDFVVGRLLHKNIS